MVATQEQTHKMLYSAEGERSARGVCVCVGGGGGGRDTVHWYAYTGICIYPAGRVSDFMHDFFVYNSCRGASPF